MEDPIDEIRVHRGLYVAENVLKIVVLVDHSHIVVVPYLLIAMWRKVKNNA